jgi:hypothetical protein
LGIGFLALHVFFFCLVFWIAWFGGFLFLLFYHLLVFTTRVLSTHIYFSYVLLTTARIRCCIIAYLQWLDEKAVFMPGGGGGGAKIDYTTIWR